jgi:hypothetical protein
LKALLRLALHLKVRRTKRGQQQLKSHLSHLALLKNQRFNQIYSAPIT